jgi:hypothetical protein
MDIQLDDGTVETVLVDDHEYLWAMQWLMENSIYSDLGWVYSTVERLRKAIGEYAEVGLMLDEILGTWR